MVVVHGCVQMALAHEEPYCLLHLTLRKACRQPGNNVLHRGPCRAPGCGGNKLASKVDIPASALENSGLRVTSNTACWHGLKPPPIPTMPWLGGAMLGALVPCEQTTCMLFSVNDFFGV